MVAGRRRDRRTHRYMRDASGFRSEHEGVGEVGVSALTRRRLDAEPDIMSPGWGRGAYERLAAAERRLADMEREHARLRREYATLELVKATSERENDALLQGNADLQRANFALERENADLRAQCARIVKVRGRLLAIQSFGRGEPRMRP